LEDLVDDVTSIVLPSVKIEGRLVHASTNSLRKALAGGAGGTEKSTEQLETEAKHLSSAAADQWENQINTTSILEVHKKSREFQSQFQALNDETRAILHNLERVVAVREAQAPRHRKRAVENPGADAISVAKGQSDTEDSGAATGSASDAEQAAPRRRQRKRSR